MSTDRKKYILVIILLIGWFFALVYAQQQPELFVRQNNVGYNKPTFSENKSHVIRRPRCGEFDCLTGEEFLSTFNQFQQHEFDQEGNSESTADQFVFSDHETESYVKNIAESLGYRKQNYVDESRLVNFEGLQILPEVRDAYIGMRDAMNQHDTPLHLVSAYRSFDHQKEIFFEKLGDVDISKITSGIYDAKIREVLERSALPGYSKHHTGYAVDFGCGNDYLVFTFDKTPCYEWMSQNNFENAKHYGFIPSYPKDTERQGPQPEPWEYVWVTSDYLN